MISFVRGTLSLCFVKVFTCLVGSVTACLFIRGPCFECFIRTRLFTSRFFLYKVLSQPLRRYSRQIANFLKVDFPRSFLPSFVQCCFRSTEIVRIIRDGEPRTASSTFTRLPDSDRPAKTEEETVAATARTTMLRMWDSLGTPPVPSIWCAQPLAVPTVVRNKVTWTVSEKQLSRNNSAARQSIQL